MVDATVDSTAAAVEDAGDTAVAEPAPLCPRLVPGPDPVRVTPDLDGAALAAALAAAPEGATVVFAPGIYTLGGVELRLDTPGVTVLSESGYGDDVLIEGAYDTETLLHVTASEVHVGALSFAHSIGSLIDVTPAGGDLSGVHLSSLLLYDPGGVGVVFGTDDAGHYVDDAEIGCTSLQLTSAGRGEVSRLDPEACATGGIDARGSDAPWIHDNAISGFWCGVGISGAGIHVGGGARGAVVERNLLLDDAQGVLIGDAPPDETRAAPDGGCPDATGPVAVYGAMVRNNAVTLTDPGLPGSDAGFRVGISLDGACDVAVVHNTVFSAWTGVEGDVDARGAGTRATVVNNLSSHEISAAPAATVTSSGNLVATEDWLTTDLHLREGAPAVDAADRLTAGTCADDRDGDLRDALPDVGADER